MKKIFAIIICLLLTGVLGLSVFADENISENEDEKGDVVLFTPTDIDYNGMTDEDIQNLTDTIVQYLEDWKGEDEWGTFVEDKIVPIIVTALTTVTALVLAFYKLYTMAKTLIEKMKSDVDTAKDTLQSAVEEADYKKLTEQVKTLLEQKADLEKQTEQIKAVVDEAKRSAEEARDIAKLGFTNMKELVVSGYADEIRKVGNKDEVAVETEETDSD